MTRELGSHGRWLLIGVVCAGWLWCMSYLGTSTMLARLGGYTGAVLLLLTLLDGETIRRAFGGGRRALVGSLVATAVMLVATYGGYRVALQLWPGLGAEVRELYRLLEVGGLTGAGVLWLVPIIVAEELFFRGTLWRLGEAMSPGAIILLSTGVYGLAQFGSGNPALLALSLVCGAYWAGWRAWSGSLWPALVSHVLWDLAVLVLWPLES